MKSNFKGILYELKLCINDHIGKMFRKADDL